MDRFLAERRSGLGGSDMPVIMGVSPFGRTPLDVWREKMGYGESVVDTASMQRGRRLEPVAAEEFVKATGANIVTGVTIYRHPERPYLIGHVDGLIEDADGWSGILEIKVPNIQTFLRYRREGLADYIVIQQQSYLAVTGKQWSSAWIWNPELWQGIEVKVKRDEDIIDLIYAKADEFWHYVETKTPPPESGAKTSLPEMPAATSREVVNLGGLSAWDEAAHNLRLASELKDEAERIYEESKARIAALMDSYKADVAEGAGLRVYHRTQAGRKSLDKEALLADLIQHREVLKAILAHGVELPAELLDRLARLMTKPIKEASYQKQGRPFRVFKPYFLNHNQLEQ